MSVEADIAVIKEQVKSMHEKLDDVLRVKSKVERHGANIRWLMVIGGFLSTSLVALGAALVSRGH